MSKMISSDIMGVDSSSALCYVPQGHIYLEKYNITDTVPHK